MNAVRSLATELRTSTMKEHKITEGASFIKNLFQGECSEKEYTQYLWALRELYKTLEDLLTEYQSQPNIALVFFPELFRQPSLSQDLKIWGAETEIPKTVKQAAENYANHLKTLGKSNPALLVAHAYVRYLGDLSGGQMMGRVLQRQYPNRDGFNFYKFDIPDAEQMKNLYRSRLDQVGELSPGLIDNLCAEAQLAFRLNEDIFKSLSS